MSTWLAYGGTYSANDNMCPGATTLAANGITAGALINSPDNGLSSTMTACRLSAKLMSPNDGISYMSCFSPGEGEETIAGNSTTYPNEISSNWQTFVFRKYGTNANLWDIFNRNSKYCIGGGVDSTVTGHAVGAPNVRGLDEFYGFNDTGAARVGHIIYTTNPHDLMSTGHPAILINNTGSTSVVVELEFDFTESHPEVSDYERDMYTEYTDGQSYAVTHRPFVSSYSSERQHDTLTMHHAHPPVEDRVGKVKLPSSRGRKNGLLAPVAKVQNHTHVKSVRDNMAKDGSTAIKDGWKIFQDFKGAGNDPKALLDSAADDMPIILDTISAGARFLKSGVQEIGDFFGL